MQRKGLILGGGKGSRLYPASMHMSKVLLPVLDKPMVYYPLCTLMSAHIRDILFVVPPKDIKVFKHLLANGSQWGMNFSYAIQKKPKGIAEALIIGRKFIAATPCMLALGDNIFYGSGFASKILTASANTQGAGIFVYWVKDPRSYGVAELDACGRVLSIQEKPSVPKSHYAVTGLYLYDENVADMASQLTFSLHGELEITDLNSLYLQQQRLSAYTIGRGYAWFDAGTFETLLEASNFVATIEKQQGLRFGCPEELALRNGWIDDGQIEKLGEGMKDSTYGRYLLSLLEPS